MASETVTEFETVERERERTLCDFCGQADDDLEEFGEFHELLLSTDPEDFELDSLVLEDERLARLEQRGPIGEFRRRVDVGYTGPTADLCPICFDTLFGDSERDD